MDKTSKETEDGVFEELVRYDLLVIDEIGRGGTSEWERAHMFRLIDERYMAGCKPTIACTNHTRAKLVEYLDEAGVSRLESRGSAWLSTKLRDHRKAKERP
jgi:DNA replication protein DnaC